MFDVNSFFLFTFFLFIFSISESSGGRDLDINDLSRIANYEVICKLQPDKYDCSKRGYSSYGFYYDIKMEDCKSTPFGTCSDNHNKFSTLSDCKEHCRDAGLDIITANISEQIFCRLQPDFGQCNDYYPMWYFDISERACKGFSYSGCGGNLNRFHTLQVCTAHCGVVLASVN